jgi:GNAT superfamily N-acetyltransferase
MASPRQNRGPEKSRVNDVSMLFQADGHPVRELRDEDLDAVQALFDANADYFVLVGGQPPRPDEARTEFAELPPPHLTFSRRHFAGVFAPGGALVGLLVVVTDLGAAGVWHVALLLLDRPVRGTGLAHRLLHALEAWALAGGARWLRLGVVEGNAVAERFWARCGLREVRRREYVNASGRTVGVRVMAKPLAGGTLDEYLRLVPRDAPGSPLP